MRVPLGISDFGKLRREGYDYVDKSLLIRDLIEEPAGVVLLPRPRRFGKTLNLSMLRHYFERPVGEGAEERWALFQDLAIAQAGERYRAQFQRYPTIYLSFKDMKDPSWEEWLDHMARLLSELYEEHKALLPTLEPWRQESFQAVLRRRATPVDLQGALLDLSRYLAQHHGQPVLVLLDEYDTPLHAAHQLGYYEKAVGFFRNLLSAVLKDNGHLHKGVLTGILRVAKDNIFSGLNNITVFSLLAKPYATAFGFTQAEVEVLLEKAGLGARLAEVQRWYNGYLFGEQVIYNPWSVLSFVRQQPEQPEPYWANSSGNELVLNLLRDHGAASQATWEALLRGEVIESKLVESVALRDLADDPEQLWSVLVFSGYLKVLGRRLEGRASVARLSIPNEEVLSIYEEQFKSSLNQGLGGDAQRRAFLEALLRGEAQQVEQHLSGWLLRHASYHDTAQVDQPERFYHGLVLGLLVSLGEEYEVRSNPEAGYGRCDVLIRPRRAGRPGVVLELKVANRRKRETLAAALKAAQAQLLERAYGEALRAGGAEPVHQLAVAWLGKEVRVASLPAPKARRPATRRPGKRPARPR